MIPMATRMPLTKRALKYYQSIFMEKLTLLDEIQCSLDYLTEAQLRELISYSNVLADKANFVLLARAAAAEEDQEGEPQ